MDKIDTNIVITAGITTIALASLWITKENVVAENAISMLGGAIGSAAIGYQIGFKSANKINEKEGQ